jgi:hypothetical protein
LGDDGGGRGGRGRGGRGVVPGEFFIGEGVEVGLADDFDTGGSGTEEVFVGLEGLGRFDVVVDGGGRVVEEVLVHLPEAESRDEEFVAGGVGADNMGVEGEGLGAKEIVEDEFAEGGLVLEDDERGVNGGDDRDSPLGVEDVTTEHPDVLFSGAGVGGGHREG